MLIDGNPLPLSEDRRRVVSQCQGSMAPTRRRTGARQNGASLGSDQQAAHPRSLGALSGDRALELVWGSGKIPSHIVQDHRVFIQYHVCRARESQATKGDTTKRTVAPVAGDHHRRSPLFGEPVGTTHESGVFAHRPIRREGVVLIWDAGEEGRGGYVYVAPRLGLDHADLRAICEQVLRGERDQVRATNCRIEEHSRASRPVVGVDAETQKGGRAS